MHDHEERLDTLAREAKNARKVLLKYVKDSRNACQPCRELGKMQSCSRSEGHNYCTNCEDSPFDCVWDEGSMESRFQGWKNASQIEDLDALIMPISAAEEESEMLRTGGHLPDPYPETSHFLVLGWARKSSHPGAPTMMQTLANLINSIGLYDNMLNGPNFAGTIEGTRPGGQGSHMHRRYFVMARHGAMPVPTHTGNVQNPVLHQFVALIDFVTRPQNPNPPTEIHFVLMGHAGFSVDITGWGDRTTGWIKMILDRDLANGTNIADRMYLVPLVERFVVDPNSSTSINQGQAPYGIRLNNKQITKYKLLDVIDRHEQLRSYALANGNAWSQLIAAMMLFHQGQNPVLPGQMPVWNGPALEAARMDRFIMAMYMEKAWRVGWLDANTVPTDAFVAANNVGRNNAM